MKKVKKIFVCCTEQSGENICYNVLKRISKNKLITIDGVCGSKSSKFITNKYYDISDFKSMGIFEIIKSLPKYLNIINFLLKKIIKNNYDIIITIDSPDFNYQLVKKIRKSNFKIKIIHIVAPTVWAWRAGRARKFSKVYDEIFTLFKFENKYFNKHGLKTTFIGHPIYYINKTNPKIQKKYVSFLPGSRENEVNSLFKYFDIAHNLLLENKQNKFEIFIPTVPHLKQIIKFKTKKWKIKTVITDNNKEIENNFKKVFVSLTCSGTASLEVSKRLIPQLIIYKFNFFTIIIGKLLVKIKFANLINIFSNKMIIPELTNLQLNKNNFTNEFNELIKNNKRNNTQIKLVQKKIKYFQNNKSPYDICVSRIKKLL